MQRGEKRAGQNREVKQRRGGNIGTEGMPEEKREDDGSRVTESSIGQGCWQTRPFSVRQRPFQTSSQRPV